MKFWYMESQRPTRDERSWVIGMAEAGFNINYDAFHFDIHKTIAYKVGCRPHEIGQTDKKLTPLEERFSQITSRRMTFLTATRLV